MKKILLLAIFSVVYSFANAQEKYSEWHSSYFDKTYDVSTSKQIANGKFDIYIDATSGSNASICINITNDQVPAFITFLQNVRAKYIEWTNVAKTNNITDMTKAMDYKTPSCTICWLWGDEWHFSFNRKLQPVFMVLDEGRIVTGIKTKSTASDNRYITEDLYLVWGCVEDIDSLIEALDVQGMYDKLNKRQNQATLFN